MFCAIYVVFHFHLLDATIQDFMGTLRPSGPTNAGEVHREQMQRN